MKETPFKEYKTLLPYLKRYRFHYLWGFLCLILTDAAQMVIPQCIRRAIDLISQGRFDWYGVLALAGVMMGVMVPLAGGRFLWRFFIYGSARKIEAELRDRLFTALLSLSYDFYQQHKIGDLMARATNDLTAVRHSIGMGFVACIDGLLMSAGILVIIFVQDRATASLAVIPLPLITALILLFGRAVGRRFQRAHEAYSTLSDTVQESFAGIRVVKSFVKEWWVIRRFAEANDEYRNANMALVKRFGPFFPLITFLAGLTTLTALLVGGSRVLEGLMSPGSLVALFSYLMMLIWPLMGAGFTVTMIQRGAVSLGRVNQVLNTKPSIASPIASPEHPAPPPPEGAGAEIELRGLHFAYPEGPAVLEDITLAIPPGTVLGILGRTGCGKSTLVKTLVRLVDPPVGTVLVKGRDVREWDLDALRGLFGVSPQESILFSDTIKANIAYRLDPSAPFSADAAPADAASAETEGHLKKAAALSAIDRDFAAFQKGWDTLIGERGLTLSGGQKQRVAIARAVLGTPEVLILDDGLSAVDAETEGRMLGALLEERRGKTTIIVSHRVSALGRADLVVVLEKGRIAEAGPPATLALQGGFYAATAALQQLS